VEAAQVDGSSPSVIGKGGVIVTSIANCEIGIMGGLAYVGVRLISVSAGLDVGLCCAMFTVL
jgi:hypothetical protein